MTKSFIFVSATGAVLSIAGSVNAQTVYPPIQITNATQTGGSYVEPSIAVSKVNPGHIVVGCNETVGSLNTLWYALTNNGYATDTRGHFPTVNCTGVGAVSFNPATASSPVTDDLWVGGIVGYFPGASGFAIWNCPPGSSSLGEQGVICNAPGSFVWYDKGLVAVGPSPTHAGSYRMYLGFTKIHGACGSELQTLFIGK